jgi:hypothetical protein
MTLRDSSVQFVAADLPEANMMMVSALAVVAQQCRTNVALAAARARGKKLAVVTRRAGNVVKYRLQA